MRIGDILTLAGDIELNHGRLVTQLSVTNTATQSIGVGSHTHFFEVNPALDFDREASRGQHLDIPPGAVQCFEPGVTLEVALVPYTGSRQVYGGRGAIMGALDVQEQTQ